MFLIRRILKTAWPRRVAALCVALAYGYLCAGVPLPSVAKVSAERFPCENCACGCSSAEQCWTHCCCHTLGQRLAWAQREGVTPPSYVLAQIEVEVAKPACCQTQRSCCSSMPATRSCCAKEKTHDAKHSGTIGWRALECQGHKTGWLVATPTIVFTIDDMVSDARVTWLCAIASDAVLSISFPPVEPPPRLLVG